MWYLAQAVGRDLSIDRVILLNALKGIVGRYFLNIRPEKGHGCFNIAFFNVVQHGKVKVCRQIIVFHDLHKVNNLTVHGFQQCMEGEIIPITGKKLCMKVTV